MPDIDQLVEEICRAHKKFCDSRKVNMNFCGGMTVENMPHKCKGCPYNSEWSCLVKFTIMHGEKQ